MKPRAAPPLHVAEADIMALHRFTSTSQATLRPLGRTSERDFQRIFAYLSEHKPFGLKFAQLFAEPVYVRGGDTIDWYWGAETTADKLVPLTSLAEPDRERILSIVRDRLSMLREEAQRLHARGDSMAGPLLIAASVPEPLADYIWWIPRSQDEDGGRPVLVAWGFANEDPRAVGSGIEATRPRVAVSSPSQTEAAGFTASSLSAGPTPVRSRWLLAGLLWLLFAAICVAIGVMLLRGCGIDTALWGLPDIPGLSYCVRPQAQEPPQPDRARELAALISELELAVSRREATCLAELRPPARVPEAPPPVPPTEPRPTVTSQEIDDASRGLNLERGEVEIWLAWKSKADLDLHVVCPGSHGKIFYNKLANCGGKLDHDSNSSSDSAVLNPIEHAVLSSAAPRGLYKIEVRLYKRNSAPGTQFPFTVRIKNRGIEKTFEGTVTDTGGADGTSPPVTVTTFNRQ